MIEYSEALYHVIWSSHLDYIGKSTPEKALKRLNAQNQAVLLTLSWIAGKGQYFRIPDFPVIFMLYTFFWCRRCKRCSGNSMFTVWSRLDWWWNCSKVRRYRQRCPPETSHRRSHIIIRLNLLLKKGMVNPLFPSLEKSNIHTGRGFRTQPVTGKKTVVAYIFLFE